MTRLDLFKETILRPDSIRGTGKALPLFLFVALNSGKNNMLKTSYEDLELALGVPASTLKKWRDCLEENKVIETVAGKGSMILKLISPYDAIATCEIDDASEVRRIGDPSMKRVMQNLSSIDMVTVIASLGKIADKVGRLEQRMEKDGE